MLHQGIGLSIRAILTRCIVFRELHSVDTAARLSLHQAIARCIEAVMRFTHRRNSGALRGASLKKSTRTQSAVERTSERGTLNSPATGDGRMNFVVYGKKFNQNGTYERSFAIPKAFFSSLSMPLTCRSCESDRRSIIAYNPAIHEDWVRPKFYFLRNAFRNCHRNRFVLILRL